MTRKWIQMYEGSADHSAFWWAVQEDQYEEGFAVLESYDQGQSWLVNDIFATKRAAMNFVEGWMSKQDEFVKAQMTKSAEQGES